MPYIPPQSRYAPKPIQPQPVAPLTPPHPPAAAVAPAAPKPAAPKPTRPQPTPAPQPTPPDQIMRRDRIHSGQMLERISLDAFEPDPRELVASIFGGHNG